MPPIYKLKCSNYGHEEDGLKIKWRCRFDLSYGGAQMCLKLDDGSEEILPHPLEDSIAMKLTGKSPDQLSKEGKIIFVEPEICLNCLSYKNNCKCGNSKFVKIKDLEGKTCPECGKGIIEKSYGGFS